MYTRKHIIINNNNNNNNNFAGGLKGHLQLVGGL